MERTCDKVVEDRGGQGGIWRTGQSHICVRISQEEQLGNEIDHATQGSSDRKENFNTSGCKNLWRLQWQEKLPVSQECLLEGPTTS